MTEFYIRPECDYRIDVIGQLSLLLEEKALITLRQMGSLKYESGHLRLILYHSLMELPDWPSQQTGYL